MSIRKEHRARKQRKLDSEGQDWQKSFQNSRWFTRGWTLQELLAPEVVEFYSLDKDLIGDKRDLAQQIHEITGIAMRALSSSSVHEFPIAERLDWVKGCNTKKKEDEAYCLLGLFDVYMPLIYGEGKNAWNRLREQICKAPKSSSLLRVVDGAVFNANNQSHDECRPATRRDSLRTIQDWSCQQDGESIFWLNGMAGTGKSTVSFTMAQWLDKQGSSSNVKLGGSFFLREVRPITLPQRCCFLRSLAILLLISDHMMI